MIVTSTREFRGNQTRYLDLANRGETVILRSGRKGSFKLVPIETKPASKPKRDLTAELCAALREVKEHIEGKRELKSLDDLLDEL